MRPEATDYLRAAIKGASLRQTAIANNIANMNVPGYRRGSVAFEQTLASAIQNDSDSIDDVHPLLVQAAPAADGSSGVNIDQEVGELMKNSAMFKSYFRLLNKMIQQAETAIGQ